MFLIKFDNEYHEFRHSEHCAEFVFSRFRIVKAAFENLRLAGCKYRKRVFRHPGEFGLFFFHHSNILSSLFTICFYILNNFFLPIFFFLLIVFTIFKQISKIKVIIYLIKPVSSSNGIFTINFLKFFRDAFSNILTPRC